MVLANLVYWALVILSISCNYSCICRHFSSCERVDSVIIKYNFNYKNYTLCILSFICSLCSYPAYVFCGVPTAQMKSLETCPMLSPSFPSSIWFRALSSGFRIMPSWLACCRAFVVSLEPTAITLPLLPWACFLS